MEVTALIVDDEHKNRETLVKLIDQFCYGIKVIGQAENVQAAKPPNITKMLTTRVHIS